MDEDIAFRGELTKDRVQKEYFRRVKKIWRSELYSKNKVIAHNTFATPIFTLTFGVLEWTKEEILQIDIKTRKILTYTGNFHRNSSVPRLYGLRVEGGRGLNSIYDIFVTRMIALHNHLEEAKSWNHYLDLVLQHEETRIVRISNELQTALSVDSNRADISKATKDSIKKEHLNTYRTKEQHGYVYRTQANAEGYNKKLSNSWMSKTNTISHTEGYILAMQEQEINTRALKAKREHKNDPTFDQKCRFCHSKTEDIFHLLCSCDHLAASLYLPMRHNEVAQSIYNSIIQRHFPTQPYTRPRPVWKREHLEIWWDIHITTAPRVKHNKPDIVVWDETKKQCMIIDICVPLDLNVTNQEKTKTDTYAPLIVGLLRLYPTYTFEVVPVVIGATGLITDSLVKNVERILDLKNVDATITNLQRKALIGSMRVMKSALAMKQ